MLNRLANARVGRTAIKNANGQFAPGALYMIATQRTGTPAVTSPKTAESDDQPPISRTSPVASLTKTGGFAS
jgi:hypothetical protein